MKGKSLVSCFAAVFVLFACAVPVIGQEFRGQITGRILDPSGASIPGAQITIKNLATGVASSVARGYAGSYTFLVDTDILNAVPKTYLSTKPERDQTTIDFLTANVTNPFAGLIPGTGLNGSTVQRQQLLRRYPEFTGTIHGRRNDGSTIYHSGQFKAEKRFSQGYT